MSKTFKAGWHVLYVKSCQEKKVHQLLQASQLKSFLPMTKTIRKWSDRKKVIYKPLFPSYVFVNINSPIELHKALSIDGACGYIRFGTEYAKVTKTEIEKIKLLIDSKHVTDFQVEPQQLRVGEMTKISYGPLSGLECEILKVNNSNKIVVRINSLQQNITATIPFTYLFETLNTV